MRNLPTDNGIAPAASEANDTATTQTVLDLRRQSPRLDAVRAIRPEPRADRAPARRGGGLARQSGHDRGLARRLRARAPRARRPLRADQARARPVAGRRRGRDSPRDRARLAVRFRSRRPRAPRSRRSICASARCAPAPPGRTPTSARSSATSSCSASARPAPARPGSRSRTRSRCSSARRSTASSCRARRSKPASGSAFCRATCARRSIPICGRSTMRCST